MRLHLLFLFFCLVSPAFAEAWTFQKGDTVAFIGNALPDRMQHDGWLETYLHTTYPEADLVIRNMGFTGDEVDHRPRNQNFMRADKYLEHVGTDVIFAFFGYNESYGRDPGPFKEDLAKWIDKTRKATYNGESAPRIVLFAPIAHENLETPNLPDGEENNRWLSIYTDAMARVAHDKNVRFVDLFAASRALYEEHDEPLTINGVHLNAVGNEEIAKAIVEDLAGRVRRVGARRVREAVLDKNWCWFNRYRATDGNDVWGSRASLEFVDKQTNEVVLQHELVMLDVMTANRDKVIHAAVRGDNIEPDDSNVPDPIQVKTNYEPSAKNGTLEYVKPEDGVKTLTLEEGLAANLFASEEMFPELVNPVQLDVDTRGRLWVAAWPTYPKWQPDQEMNDRLLILPDEDRDGVADEAITFAYIHNPTGFTFWNGGVLVASAPNIWFLKDTDGDDKADVRELVLTGLDSADTHHSANGFDYGPDGYLYYQRGVFHVSNVETPWERAQLDGASAMYRWNPRTHRFSHHADNPPNPHGGDFDYWGYHFATSATGGEAYQVRMDGEGGFVMHKLLEKTVRPVPSSGILSSTHFPQKNNGNFIILNSIGFLGIKQYTLEYTDGEVWGTETDDLLVSSDGNFRPSDFKIGDDGALYVADWANALIGHMQHNIRDPSRDHQHGRIYRITVPGRPLEEHVDIDGEPIDHLLHVLKHPTNQVRVRARTELSERDTDEVIAAAQEWIKQFDGTSKEDAHHLLEALWLHQQHNVINEGLLTLLLHSPHPDAQRAAQRVKYMWEIEGQIGEATAAAMDHTAHHAKRPERGIGEDLLKQEPSPEPKLVDGVMEVHVHTLKEQMRYDRTHFAVAPGMKVRLTLKNPDWMEHNLLVVQPGSASEVATAAMMLGASGIQKNWTPENPNIMHAIEVLSAGESATIEFTAPEQIGEYPYICTYPGHWTLMNGIMHVVDDVDAWIAANPDTAAPTGIGGDVATEWTVADLAGDLDSLRDRSIERGAEIFKAASCSACHTLDETAGALAPNLHGVAERLDPKAMLTELIEPSAVINEDYKPWRIELNDFSEVYGIITEEHDDYIRVMWNPLEDQEGMKVAREDIADMRQSTLSTMPVGLLNTFQKEDILDLMAYIRSLKE